MRQLEHYWKEGLQVVVLLATAVNWYVARETQLQIAQLELRIERRITSLLFEREAARTADIRR